MKTLFYSLAILLSSLFLTSCSPDQFNDPMQDQDSPALGAFGAETTHDGLVAECGPWTTVELTDSDGSLFLQGVATPYGSLQLNNDPDNMAIRMSLGNNWFMDQASVYYGDLRQVVQNGQIDPNAFQLQKSFSQACNSYEWLLAKQATGANNDFIFMGEVCQMSGFFNGLDENTRTRIYGNANSFANGFSFDYTFATCAAPLVSGADECARVYQGYEDAECTDLNMIATGGTPPYAISWNTGQSGSTIQVCPSQTSTYTATLTDANGISTTTTFTVHVEDVGCGNRNKKVQICHVPPGNPANAHAICISKNAVPAHIDPHVGHSGCYLGACNVANPCQ